MSVTVCEPWSCDMSKPSVTDVTVAALLCLSKLIDRPLDEIHIEISLISSFCYFALILLISQPKHSNWWRHASAYFADKFGKRIYLQWHVSIKLVDILVDFSPFLSHPVYHLNFDEQCNCRSYVFQISSNNCLLWKHNSSDSEFVALWIVVIVSSGCFPVNDSLEHDLRQHDSCTAVWLWWTVQKLKMDLPKDVSLAEAGKYGSLNDFAFFDKVG